MTKHSLILILFSLILLSCFKERRLKKEFNIHNNTKIVKLVLKQNGEYLQQTEYTNLVRKQKGKRKRKYDKPKLKELEFKKHILIDEGFWEQKGDTILVHSIIRYPKKYSNYSKFYKISIEEKYDSSISNSVFEVVKQNDKNFDRISIVVNENSNSRRRLFEGNLIQFPDSIINFDIYRSVGTQYFEEYRPKNRKSNYFKIIVTEVNRIEEILALDKYSTKHFLVKGNFAIPGVYIPCLRCHSRKQYFWLREFDYSIKIPILD